MEKPVLVVMAAGMGSRYGGLKQMDPLGPSGQLIIDYSLYDAKRAGFEKVVFVIKKAIEEPFKAAIGARAAKEMEVAYAFQEVEDLPAGYAVPAGRVKPWGTAHAVLSARRLIHGPFAVINSDDYYGPNGFKALYRFLSTHGDAEKYSYAMVGYRLANTVTESGCVARGVCQVDGGNRLTAIVERTRIEKDGDGAKFTEDGGATWERLPGDTLVSMNLWGFTHSFLVEAEKRFSAFLDKTLAENPEKGEYYLPMVVEQLLAEDKATVEVLATPDKWYGVTYQADRPVVVEALARLTREGLYPAEF